MAQCTLTNIHVSDKPIASIVRCQNPPNKLHVVITKKNLIFILTVFKTSDVKGNADLIHSCNKSLLIRF